MSFKFNLGDEVKTKVTGFKGIVRGRSDYLTGCNTYGLQRQKLDKDGIPMKWQWFDEHELILLKEKKINLEPEEQASATTKTGGPLPKDQISRD